MARGTAFQSPAHVVARAGAPGQATPGNAPNQAPSLVHLGTGLYDPRVQYNSLGAFGVVLGWQAQAPIISVNATPAAQSATNIAAAAVPVAGTPMTLVSSTGAGITVLATALPVYPGYGVVPVGGLAIETSAAKVVMGGTNATTAMYDPTTGIARNIRITSVGNDSTATFTVRGYDLYGYPMAEVITGANAGIATGVKCFKFVTSVTPAGTLSGSNASVGTGDVFGFPLRVTYWEQLEIFWNGALVTSSTGFTAADATSPATGTTGDVRGKYGVQSASDGSKRLLIKITPLLADVSATNPAVGLTGVTPYTV